MRRTATYAGILGVLVGAVCPAACGERKAVSNDSGRGITDGGSSQTGLVCDGSADIRLMVVVSGGGPGPPGSTMLSENGWRFLLVNGSCTAWVLPSHTEPLRTLTLSPDQERQLALALRLSDWSTFEGQHPGGCADAPGIFYRFGQRRITGPVCGVAANDPLEDLNAAFDGQVAALGAAATPVTGDVRYLVLRDPNLGAGDTRKPAPWPRGIPIESVALTQQQAFQYMPGTSARATGTDAARLRAIRTGTDVGAGGLVYDFTPVLAMDGTIYQLYLRDSVPIENDNGLLPRELF